MNFRSPFFTAFRRSTSPFPAGAGSRSPVAVAEPPQPAVEEKKAEPGPEELDRQVDAEIAAVWGVPLGYRVEVTLRDHALTRLTGRLELHRMPERPFSAERLLVLKIDRDMFTNRQIETWTLQL